MLHHRGWVLRRLRAGGDRYHEENGFHLGLSIAGGWYGNRLLLEFLLLELLEDV